MLKPTFSRFVCHGFSVKTGGRGIGVRPVLLTIGAFVTIPR